MYVYVYVCMHPCIYVCSSPLRAGSQNSPGMCIFLSQAWDWKRQDVMYDGSLFKTMCNKDYALCVYVCVCVCIHVYICVQQPPEGWLKEYARYVYVCVCMYLCIFVCSSPLELKVFAM